MKKCNKVKSKGKKLQNTDFQVLHYVGTYVCVTLFLLLPLGVTADGKPLTQQEIQQGNWNMQIPTTIITCTGRTLLL